MRAKLCAITADAAEQARRQRGVLAAAALAVVRVADDDPACAERLVARARSRRTRTSCSPVSTLRPWPTSPRERVARAREQVVAELVEVAAVAQPRAGRRDVVGGRLALRLHEDGQVAGSRGRPTRATARAAAGARSRGRSRASTPAPLCGRRDVRRAPPREAGARHLGRARGRLEHERLAVGADE